MTAGLELTEGDGFEEVVDLTATVAGAGVRSTRLSTENFELDVITPATTELPFVPQGGALVRIPFYSTVHDGKPQPDYHSLMALIDDVVWLQTIHVYGADEVSHVLPLNGTTPQRCIGFDGYEATVAGISFDGDEGAFMLGAGEERAFHRDGVPFVAQVFRAEIQDPDITIAEGLVRRLADE